MAQASSAVQQGFGDNSIKIGDSSSLLVVALLIAATVLGFFALRGKGKS